MYIRKVTQIHRETGKEYHTHRLVETYRNAEGKVRQRVMLNLGANFDIPSEQWKLLADRIEEILRGQETLAPPDETIEQAAKSIADRVVHRSAEIPKAVIAGAEEYCSVDVNSLTHHNVRLIGAEHVGLEAAKQLKIPELLVDLQFNRRQIHTALGSIIGRLVSPGSERSIHRYLQRGSGLDELMGCDFQQLSLDQLYQISDKLLQNKKEIESRLYQQEKDLFQLEDMITLYDLTNTYFEGKALTNAKAAYGRSKEKRSDCPLVTLGLVLDSSGFPKKSEIYEGNISEPKTLKEMIERLKGDRKPTVVLDAGIASEENIEWLKDQGYCYVVVSKKAKQWMPEGVFLEHQKHYRITAKLIKNEETSELELYCHSELKDKKEQAMMKQACHRYEQGLKKISEGLKKKSNHYDKIAERAGRLKERYKSVGYLYEVTIIADELKKKAIAIEWKRIADKQKLSGTYCLRSNRDDLNEQSFWNIYQMLTDLEASFRSLKSELGLRPVYHRKTDRVDSHIFITLLAYHLLHTVRYQLANRNIQDSWLSIRKELQTHCRITSTLKCQDGRTLHVRKTSSPSPRQIEIYRCLGIDTHPGKTEKTYC